MAHRGRPGTLRGLGLPAAPMRAHAPVPMCRVNLRPARLPPAPDGRPGHAHCQSKAKQSKALPCRAVPCRRRLALQSIDHKERSVAACRIGQQVNVKLIDVAQLAGVDISTASRVLRGESMQRIREETRGRILASARQLNYAPNELARGL